MGKQFDIERFDRLLKTRAFGHNLIFEPSVGSTMDMAREAARRGAAEGTVALADEQTAGRGRLGRSWVTPPAENLASTLILRPPAEALRQIAMITPLAICEAVTGIAGLTADIKWPNDVQIGGKKLAGILIETELGEGAAPVVLVGAGINVNFDARQFDEIKDIATSLAVELGREVEREAFLAAYLLQFEREYDRVSAGGSLRDRWRDRLITLGHRVTVTERDRVTHGMAEDVDADGALLVRTDDGALATIEAGDVTLRT